MEKVDLYDTMFKRRSVRRYEDTPLDEPTLAKIASHMATLKPLYDGIRTEMKIVPGGAVRGLFGVKAPHFLVLFSEGKTGYRPNAGFLLQQMDLWLSANGIGSCWQGLAKPSKELARSLGLECVITLAFGRPSEPLHRQGTGEFKRKPIEKIRDATGMDDLLEPARLAPSTSNRQMWFFTGRDGRINVYTAKALLLDRWGPIDAGIAICHIWIAAIHQGKHFEVVHDQGAEMNASPGRFYIATLSVT